MSGQPAFDFKANYLKFLKHEETPFIPNEFVGNSILGFGAINGPAIEKGGADGISLINTMLGMRIDLNRKKPIIANKMGGFSGAAIFPVAVRMVYQVAHAVDIPVVGMGGVSSAEDVVEMMLAGATAVQVGAANLIDPFACKKIIEDLPATMQKYGINSLEEIIKGVR